MESSESSVDATASCSSSTSSNATAGRLVNQSATSRALRQHTVSFAQDILVHDPVLFLAIIEFDTGGGEDNEMCFHTKLRIRTSEVQHHDVSAVPGFTALALRQRIQQHLSAGSRRSSLSNQHDQSGYHIALYDSDAEDYVSLSNVNELQDIVPRFGTRWRIRVTEQTTLNTTNTPNASSPLAIQGRYFHVPSTGSFKVANCELHFQQIDAAVNTSTGFQIWDGAVWLTRYLEQNPDLLRNHPRVLELGAGCGVVGISAALLGAQQVLVTDLPELMPLLQSNIDRNRAALRGDVLCHPCDWTQPPDLPPVDLILVADCVWMEHLVAPLLNTLRQLTDIPVMSVNPMEEASNHSLSHMDLVKGSTKDPSPVNSWADIYKGRAIPAASTCHLHDSECSCHSLHEPLDASMTDFDTDMFANESLDRSISTLERSFNTSACVSAPNHPNSRPKAEEGSFGQRSVSPRVIISYQRRGKSTHDVFWKGLRELFSHVELLPLPTIEDSPPAADTFYLLSCQR